MTFEQLIENLQNGNSTVLSVGTEQKFKAVSERVEGKETGLQIVKAVGGRVNRKVAENTLLNGLQSLLVRKGFCEFGNDGLIDVVGTETTNLQTAFIEYGIEPRFLTAIVNRFLKQIDLQFVLTDLQNIAILQAVSSSELQTAKDIKRADENDLATAINLAAKFNDKVFAERAAAVEVLTKTASV